MIIRWLIRWYSKEIAFFLYGTILGIFFSGFDLNFKFSVGNISPVEVVLSGFFGFITFQIRHNYSFKSYMDGWFRNLRRISEDPYKEYERETIINFLKMIVNADNVYTVDRNNPDTWFLNDNYIAFLCLEEELIREKNLQGNRVFIWKEECYCQSRYQQVLLLNVYASINTYIVPLEFLQKKKNEYLNFLNIKDPNLKDQMDKYSYYKSEWVNKLFLEADGEEFLLCEYNGNLNDGTGKVKTDIITARHLDFCERKCYKFFIEWIQSLKKNGKEVALLEQIPPDFDFPTHWRTQIETKLKTLKDF